MLPTGPALYYSVYDGSKWGSPEIVCDDGTVDSMPDIKKVKNNVVIAWADADREFTSQDKPAEQLGSMGISLAVYDITAAKAGREIYRNLS